MSDDDTTTTTPATSSCSCERSRGREYSVSTEMPAWIPAASFITLAVCVTAVVITLILAVAL